MLVFKNKIDSFLLLFALSIILMPALKYYSIHTTFMDLGIFFRHFFHIEKLGWFLTVFYGEVQPLLPIYSKIFYWPPNDLGVYLILIIQSLLLIAPALYIKKYETNTSFYAYILFFPVWFIALFDFHVDHLLVPLLFAFFYFVRKQRLLFGSLCAISIIMVKDVYALQTIFCGIYIILFNKTESINNQNVLLYKYIYGVILIFIGALYFYISVEGLIPSVYGGVKGGIGSTAFSWLGNDVFGILKNLFINFPNIFFDIISNNSKMFFLIVIFGSLAFIPLLSPLPIIVALPIIAISLLSQNELHYNLASHYTAGLVAPLIVSFSDSLKKLNLEKLKLFKVNALGMLTIFMLIVHILLSPSPISKLFWTNKIWSYGYLAYYKNERDFMIENAIKKYIPKKYDTVVSTQNTINILSLSERKYSMVYPQGVFDEKKVPPFSNDFLEQKDTWKKVKAEYVILDKKRPWYMVDKGCGWVYGECTNNKIAEEYINSIKKSLKIMEIIFEKDDFMILKRKSIK